MKFDLAIEIGGSNTRIFLKNEGLVLSEPTLIAAEKTSEGYSVKAIGFDAKKMQGKTDESVEIFSPISNGAITSFEYACFMLQKFLEKIELKKRNGKNAIVVIPCGLKSEEKDLFKKLCFSVGFKEVRLVPSAVAACIGAGKNIVGAKAQLICDIGGSTTDIAVVNLNCIVKGSSLCIGGKIIDVAIANTIAYNYGIMIGLKAAEKLKCEIGSLYEDDTSNMEITGIDVETKAPRTSVISSKDISYAIEPFFEELIKGIETTINISPPDISSDIVQSGLILTGGVCSMLGIEKYLRKKLKLPIFIPQNANNASIIGAGKLLTDEENLEKILKQF